MRDDIRKAKSSANVRANNASNVSGKWPFK